MTPYEILFANLTRDMYKRGAHKGDAPMEKRAKTHFRIVKGENMVVRMYNTNILTAFRNGDFEINLNGYESSSTTRANINYVLSICKTGRYISARNVMGLSQLVVWGPAGDYLYYDGIMFNQEGELLSTPKPFEARRIDRSESKEFMGAVKASGFKDMFPLLYATCTPPERTQDKHFRSWIERIQDADFADSWPEIVETFKYEQGWRYLSNGHTYGVYEVGDAKSCWARMITAAKTKMYNTIRTEVTVIPK